MQYRHLCVYSCTHPYIYSHGALCGLLYYDSFCSLETNLLILFLSPAQGLQAGIAMPNVSRLFVLWCRCWGFKLKFPCLYSRHLTHQAISSASYIPLLNKKKSLDLLTSFLKNWSQTKLDLNIWESTSPGHLRTYGFIFPISTPGIIYEILLFVIESIFIKHFLLSNARNTVSSRTGTLTLHKLYYLPWIQYQANKHTSVIISYAYNESKHRVLILP